MIEIMNSSEDAGAAIKSIFRSSPAKRQALMEVNPPKIGAVFNGGAYFDWSWMGCGCGQLSFDLEDGKFHVSNEGMSAERVRTLLHAPNTVALTRLRGARICQLVTITLSHYKMRLFSPPAEHIKEEIK